MLRLAFPRAHIPLLVSPSPSVLLRFQSSAKPPAAAPAGAKPSGGGGGGGGKKGKNAKAEAPRPKGIPSVVFGHGASDRAPPDAARAAARAERAAAFSAAGLGAGAPAASAPLTSADPVLSALLNSDAASFARPPPSSTQHADAAAALGRPPEEPSEVATAVATARFARVPSWTEPFAGRVVAVADPHDFAYLTDDEAEHVGVVTPRAGVSRSDARADAAARSARRASPVLLRGASSAGDDARATTRERAAQLADELLRHDPGLSRAQRATSASAAEAEGASVGLGRSEGGARGGASFYDASAPWGVRGAAKGLFFGDGETPPSAGAAAGLADPVLGTAFERILRGRPLVNDAAADEREEAAFDREDETVLSRAHGDDVRDIPRGILEEWASPLEFRGGGDAGGGARAAADAAAAARAPTTVLEALMTPEERVLNEKRKELRRLIEAPLPVATRPIWPLYAYIAGADQVRLVTSSGVIDSVRCMVVVGNGRGGVGFGLASHTEALSATRRALMLAQRDMIHVSTNAGALHHDLLGKKNNVYVLLRTQPATSATAKAAPALMDVLELAGITKVSAKIFGGHRRSPYVVMQALFDAFNHHKPPEVDAERRGLRLVRHTADRLSPRTVYPFNATGPRFPPTANKRWSNQPARS